jgi:hypothetical protein
VESWRTEERFEFDKLFLSLLNTLDKGGKRRTSYIKGVRFIATVCKSSQEDREAFYLTAIGRRKPTEKLLTDLRHAVEVAQKLIK